MKAFIKKNLDRLGYSVERKKHQSRIFLDLFDKYSNYTMIPKEIFIKNLYLLHKVEYIDGCIVECGVWRGGMSAAMSEVLLNRKCYLFDSFEGLPEVQEIDGKTAMEWQRNPNGDFYFNNCLAEIEFAENAMILSGTKNYRLVKGWFNETIRVNKPDEPIAILRLDADWYDSTIVCMNELFESVAIGGLIIIDDYNMWDGCSKAIHDFLSKKKSNSKIYNIEDGVTYIIKT